MPCWRYFSVHTVLLALMASSSIWTGASYYFEVFAKRCVWALVCAKVFVSYISKRRTGGFSCQTVRVKLGRAILVEEASCCSEGHEVC